MAIQFPVVSSTSRTPFPTIQELQRQQSVLFGQLASGNRITSAAIDPAGLAVAQQLTSQINGLGQAQNNIGDALSLLKTGEGALGNQESVLQQERTLAVQAGDAALNSGDLQSIQSQIQQLNQGLDQTGQQAQFNGIALLNGSSQNLNFQVGANASQTQSVTLPTSDSQQLGTASLDLTTGAGQSAGLSALDQAINTTSSNPADIG